MGAWETHQYRELLSEDDVYWHCNYEACDSCCRLELLARETDNKGTPNDRFKIDVAPSEAENGAWLRDPGRKDDTSN